MATVHPTAIVDPDAVLGEGTVVHPFAVISSGVVVGKNNVISKGASLYKNVTLGDGNFIGENVVIGVDPSHTDFDRSVESGVVIGNDNTLKEFMVVERSVKLGGHTEIGNKNMLMVNTHIAHDCKISDEVVICNLTALAGEVSIDSKTFVSGGCVFHQFVRVGKGVMVGGSTRVVGDVPPYVLVVGYTARFKGLNSVGLKRAGFSIEERKLIKQIYRFLYQSSFSKGIEEISQMPASPIRDEILSFLKKSVKRPMVRKESNDILS